MYVEPIEIEDNDELKFTDEAYQRLFFDIKQLLSKKFNAAITLIFKKPTENL